MMVCLNKNFFRERNIFLIYYLFYVIFFHQIAMYVFCMSFTAPFNTIFFPTLVKFLDMLPKHKR